LGAANLLAVGYLGELLRAARTTAAIAAAPAGIGALGALYPALLLYALGFVGVPAARWFSVRQRDERISNRNAAREAWARALASPPAETLRRKLAAARKLRPAAKRAGDANVVFKSSGDTEGGPLGGDEFDQWAAKLEARGMGKPLEERLGGAADVDEPGGRR